jgi:hypothetical protein
MVTIRCGRLVLVAGFVIAGCGKAPPYTFHETESAIGSAIQAEYPFSLIPGGVASDEEFEEARVADPLLQEHYAEVGFLRPAFLLEDRWLYASYRQGDSIFWTNSRICVRAGEAVFADRSGNMVRGRCGNRLSETARLPVAFVQPAEAVFETPEISFVEPAVLPHDPRDDLASVLFSPFPPLEAPSIGIGSGNTPRTARIEPPEWPPDEPGIPGTPIPFVVAIPPFTPVPQLPLPHPVMTPEPSGVWLFVAGGLLLIACWRWRLLY